MRARMTSTLGVVLTLGLAGCGSASPQGFASQSPDQILAASAAAVKATHSYLLSGTGVQGGTRLTVDLTYAGPRAAELGVVTAAGQVEIVVVQGRSYLRADTKFWTREANATAAKVYANRWFSVDPSRFGSLTSDIAHASPTDFAACLTTDVTRPKLVGTSTVAGQSAVELSFTSRTGAASRIWIRAGVPHYPLRVINAQGGDRQVKVGICDSGGAGASGGTVDFSRWNDAPAVRAPTRVSTLP